MSTPKQLLAKLIKRRPAALDNRKQGAHQSPKVVYLHMTEEIVAARTEYQNEATLLVQAMEDVYAGRGDGLYPDGADHDPSACTVIFASKSPAKKAAQFLADIYGFWRGNHQGTESINEYRNLDKKIRCKLDHVCCFFDPNGFMDFDFAGHQVGDVVTIDKNQHQLAKKYLQAFSQIQDNGIVPDWPYAQGDRGRIWRTYQLRVKLIRLIVSSCREKKPRPEKITPSHTITFQDDDEGIDILVDGSAPRKFTSAARRSVLALALQPDLNAVDAKKFCGEYDPVWAKGMSGTKNVPKKFTQAMQSLRSVAHGLHHELLGNGNARVAGIELKKKPSNTKLKQQISFLLKPQPD